MSLSVLLLWLVARACVLEEAPIVNLHDLVAWSEGAEERILLGARESAPASTEEAAPSSSPEGSVLEASDVGDEEAPDIRGEGAYGADLREDEAQADLAVETGRFGIQEIRGGRTSSPDAEIVIYTTSWCPVCARAIDYLDELGVDYSNYDIEEDAAANEDFLELGDGKRGVPLIVIGDQLIRGFSRTSVDRALARLE